MYKLLIVIPLFLYSCGNNGTERTHYQPSTSGQRTNHTSFSDDDEDSAESSDYDTENGLEDGTHSATVQYYNPQTGHSATYYLDVEVEDGEVNQINFPKGGWLDGTHISPEALNNGRATITDDEGREFDIEIDDN